MYLAALKHSRLFRFFWQLIFKWKGWTIEGEFPHHLPRVILVVAPHTNNIDFFLGLATRSIARINGCKFLAKAELFKPPFGWLFRSLGGIPVYRDAKRNMVDQVVEIFNRHEHFLLALSPEGTRKRVDRLKTGFYHIASQARVPIVLVAFDYGNKKIVFAPPFLPQDEKEDMDKIIRFFAPIKGKTPENGMGHFLNEQGQVVG